MAEVSFHGTEQWKIPEHAAHGIDFGNVVIGRRSPMRGDKVDVRGSAFGLLQRRADRERRARSGWGAVM